MARESLQKRLRQNGQEILRVSTNEEILVPHLPLEATEAFTTTLFLLMEKDSFRHELHDWSYSVSSPSKEVEGYLALLEHFDKALARDIKSNKELRQGYYNSTLEWFIKELFLRRFGAKAAEFGVTLKDAPTDEFDCIASTDNGLVYVECGAGKKKSLFSRNTLKNFDTRDGFLDANYSLFLLDRQDVFGGIDPATYTTPQAQAKGVFRISKITRREGKSSKATFYKVTTTVGQRWFLAASIFDRPKKVLSDMLMFTHLQAGNRWIRHFNSEDIEWAAAPMSR